MRAGEHETVREYRLKFQRVIAPELIRRVEDVVGRKIVGYHSQVIFDPDRLVEIFLMDPVEEAAPTSDVAEDSQRRFGIGTLNQTSGALQEYRLDIDRVEQTCDAGQARKHTPVAFHIQSQRCFEVVANVGWDAFVFPEAPREHRGNIMEARNFDYQLPA